MSEIRQAAKKKKRYIKKPNNNRCYFTEIYFAKKREDMTEEIKENNFIE